LPQDVSTRLVTALEKINKGKEYTEFMGSRGFGVRWAPGPEFLEFWKTSDQNLGAVMKKVGLAK
jgi:hypothetical protein